jgi:hypothetical protein
MKKRIKPTLVEKAIEAVPGFEQVFKKLGQHVILRGQSQSTLNNYIRCIANISLHFLRLPEHISDDEINEYLTAPDNACKSQLPWMVLSFYAVFVCTYFPADLLKS